MAKRATKAKAEARPDSRGRIIQAAMELATQRDWRRIALADIAAAAGLPIGRVYEIFPSKQAILNGLSREVDMAVLSAIEREGLDGSTRDRLFDLLMRRFDALKPHREGLAAVLRASGRDPLAALCGLGQFQRSMACMLEAAGVPSAGIAGAVRTAGLGLIYLSVLRIWLKDESEDKSRTMAALDMRLRRAETCAGGLGRRAAAA